MKKIFLSAVSVFAGMIMMTSAARADCGEITIGEMNWASGTILTSVAKFLLENGYGCKVKKIPTSTVPSVASVAETGKPDVLIELWVNSTPKYLELEKAGKVKTVSNVFADGGQEGWWVPQYLADKHPELATIEGVLANAKVVGARFHNCPVGWGCRVANDNLKVAFDLKGNGIEVFDHGSGETLATSIATAYTDKKAWFGYYWGPTAVLGKYPMQKVSLGKVDGTIHSCNQKQDCATPGKSDFPSAPVLNTVTVDLVNREPEAVEFLSRFTVPNGVLSSVLAWHEENSASPDEAATYFLKNHKDVWSKWLSEDAKKKLSGIL